MSFPMNIAKPIHPTQLAVYPGQDPRRFIRNPSPPELTPADFQRTFPGIESTTVATGSLSSHIRGDTNPGNLETLLKVAKWLNPKTILEVGTFRGRTTLGFLQNTLAEKIITLDLPLGKETMALPYGTDLEYLRTSERPMVFSPTETRISQVFADCTNARDLQETLARSLEGRKIDFAYIDAPHTYEGVMVPFTTVLPMMSPGGIIAFDDYMRPAFAPLTEAISHLSRVDGFVFYAVTFPNPSGYGSNSTLFFINDPMCIHRDWKSETVPSK